MTADENEILAYRNSCPARHDSSTCDKPKGKHQQEAVQCKRREDIRQEHYEHCLRMVFTRMHELCGRFCRLLYSGSDICCEKCNDELGMRI